MAHHSAFSRGGQVGSALLKDWECFSFAQCSSVWGCGSRKRLPDPSLGERRGLALCIRSWQDPTELPVYSIKVHKRCQSLSGDLCRDAQGVSIPATNAPALDNLSHRCFLQLEKRGWGSWQWESVTAHVTYHYIPHETHSWETSSQPGTENGLSNVKGEQLHASAHLSL